MNNIDIRFKAQSAGVRLWQIANKLAINDGNFSRKLRNELPDAEKENIMQIIDELSKESN